MRIKEIAALAGTTPRAVRHYHHLGLLDVPPTVRGKREYGVEHISRLLRIRWLADGGLSLTQIAGILAADGRDSTVTDRTAVLGELRATRGAIEAQRRSLAEQARRMDELIAHVEAGEDLSPAPAVLTRFYDDLEARVLARGGDTRSLRIERQMMVALAALGMMPDSVGPFIEELDEADLETCAEQVTGFARLAHLDGEAGRVEAHRLASRSFVLATRHKTRVLAVLDDMPGGAPGKVMWRLTHVMSATGYPHPAQRAFTTHLLELLLEDPDFATTIRRSAGEDPVL